MIIQSLPLVTILIPTYNRAHYLREAIKSALAQTHTNIEVLVLDDCSPDNTTQIAAEFAADQRVRYIRHEKNLGITGNWRAGIEAARGDYFCLLHDDDTIEPEYIQTLVQPLEEDQNLILSFCDHWDMNESRQRLSEGASNSHHYYKRDQLPPGNLKDFAWSALMEFSIPIGATLIRRSLISPDAIADDAKGAIDMWLLYQCVKTGRGAYYNPRRLMNYRAHTGGMSHSMPRHMLEGHLFRYKQILADDQMLLLHPFVKRQLAETLTKLSIALLKQGQRCEARHLIREALRYGITARNLVTYILSFGGNAGTRAALTLRKR